MALYAGSMAVSLILPSPVDHEEVLENTEAASLIANIDPHASLSASMEASQVRPIEQSLADARYDLADDHSGPRSVVEGKPTPPLDDDGDSGPMLARSDPEASKKPQP